MVGAPRVVDETEVVDDMEAARAVEGRLAVMEDIEETISPPSRRERSRHTLSLLQRKSPYRRGKCPRCLTMHCSTPGSHRKCHCVETSASLGFG